MIALHKRVSLKNRLLLQDAFNLNSMSGLVRFVKKVLIGTFIIEGLGALLYMIVFVPEFGARGIWISVFNSVSAFCNAGIDIIGSTSLMNYATNPLVNGVTAFLVIMGGIGFIVWWDVILAAKTNSARNGRFFSRLTLHSKIALCSTAVLLIAGTGLFLAFEYNNPETIGNMNLFDKMQVSFFQSVTTRTAGFDSIGQAGITDESAIISLLLMFIGGSPVGTAGGIKTVTFAVILASAISSVRGKSETTMFNRNISKEAVRKAISVTVLSFSIMFISTLLLCAVTSADILDIVYETTSATATVGLSRNLTPTLPSAGKLIIIATMYLGRVGPISLAIAFKLRKENHNIIKNPTEDISIG